MHISNNKNIEIKLLSMDFVEDLYNLVDHNRDILVKWFPWCTDSYNLQSCKGFVNFIQNRFVENKNFRFDGEIRLQK